MQKRVLMSTVMRGRRAQCTSIAKAPVIAGTMTSPWAQRSDAFSLPAEPAANSNAVFTPAKTPHWRQR